MSSPRFTDRIREAQQVLAGPDLSPELAEPDRDLARTLARLRRSLDDPRPATSCCTGNRTRETCCQRAGRRVRRLRDDLPRPVEFDLAHGLQPVARLYPGIDRGLLDQCRQLVLAMVAAQRWRTGDEFPHRRRWGLALVDALREGPPWPTLASMGAPKESPAT